MPPAAKNLFEKRFLDFQKLLMSNTFRKKINRFTQTAQRFSYIDGIFRFFQGACKKLNYSIE